MLGREEVPDARGESIPFTAGREGAPDARGDSIPAPSDEEDARCWLKLTRFINGVRVLLGDRIEELPPPLEDEGERAEFDSIPEGEDKSVPRALGSEMGRVVCPGDDGVRPTVRIALREAIAFNMMADEAPPEAVPLCPEGSSTVPSEARAPEIRWAVNDMV